MCVAVCEVGCVLLCATFMTVRALCCCAAAASSHPCSACCQEEHQSTARLSPLLALQTLHTPKTQKPQPQTKAQSPKPAAATPNLHGFKVERRVGQLGVQRRSARIAAGAALNQQENADCILLAAGNFGAFGKQPHLGGKCQCGSEARVQRNARDAAVFFSGAGTCIETASTSFCRRLKPCSGVLASISSSRSSTDRSVRAIGCRGSRAAIEREGARSGNTPAWR